MSNDKTDHSSLAWHNICLQNNDVLQVSFAYGPPAHTIQSDPYHGEAATVGALPHARVVGLRQSWGGRSVAAVRGHSFRGAHTQAALRRLLRLARPRGRVATALHLVLLHWFWGATDSEAQGMRFSLCQVTRPWLQQVVHLSGPATQDPPRCTGVPIPQMQRLSIGRDGAGFLGKGTFQKRTGTPGLPG